MLLIAAFGVSACSTGSKIGGKSQVRGIREGMSKSGVIIESGRPVENQGRGDQDFWYYADDDGRRCKVRFRDGRVTQDEIKCEDAAPDRAPAYVEAAQKYELEGKFETREQRVRRFCGLKPEPRFGCVIGECVDGVWQESCGAARPQQ